MKLRGVKEKWPDFITLFGWFIIYSYIGWVYETIYCSFDLHRYVDRGFLFGPVCPIYGVCIVGAIVLFSDRIKNNILLFFSCALLASIVEYGTSLIMEYVFGRKWWNYSNQMFNLDGRICLGAAIIFGLSGVLIIKLIHPFLVRYISEKFRKGTIKRTRMAIFVLFVLDIFVTFRRNL